MKPRKTLGPVFPNLEEPASRRTPSYSSNYGSEIQKTRFKQPVIHEQHKHTNIVHDTIKKIGQIDREADKIQKHLAEEVKNAEIYEIIKDTQQEMRNSLHEQQDILGSMQSKMTGVGPTYEQFEVGLMKQEIFPEQIEKNLETQRLQEL